MTSLVLSREAKDTYWPPTSFNDLTQTSKLIVTYRILWKSVTPTVLVTWSLGGVSEAFVGHAPGHYGNGL